MLDVRAMLPSSTVENYLKTIALQQQAGEGLVAMGQLAAALSVTPGTATTMVKTLAEAGLVLYEPYAGVRLTPAGTRLARLVLRRHRLVELFLVEVMGLRWDEVHDEAEKLEHVVSERLIERMDEMLGHPQADPHGDPIPDAEGAIPHRDLLTLLDCPLHTPLAITRVTDQDPAFLRFLEESNLKPGQTIEVEMRDEQSDSVRLRSRHGHPLTIGGRAASKLLVQVLSLVLFSLLASAWPAHAGSPAPRSSLGRDRPFEIVDNSFLVEEAFNQEAGIFQNIFGFVRSEHGDWTAAFTQEWPVPGQRHQLSYTLTFSNDLPTGRFSDIAVNYRYQLRAGDDGGLALAPRVSLLVRAHRDEGDDYGAAGWQVNMPASRQFGDVYLHANAGLTVYPGVSTGRFPSASLRPARDVTLVSPFLAGSAIVRVRSMVHLMIESVLQYDDRVDAPGHAARTRAMTVSPGCRFGWNIRRQQIVLGTAVPLVRQMGATDVALLGYASWELPFRR